MSKKFHPTERGKWSRKILRFLELMSVKYGVVAANLEFVLDEYPKYAQGRSGRWFELTAKMNGKDVGYVRYKKKAGGFSVIDLYVDAAYRRRGIATSMYNHIEENYGKLFRSKDQTDAGKAFRDARKNLS